MTTMGATQTTLPAGNPEGYHEALAILYSDFADALEANGENAPFPYPGIEEGVRGIALCDASLRSNASQGSWEKIEY
jgi:hypothetical protein